MKTRTILSLLVASAVAFLWMAVPPKVETAQKVAAAANLEPLPESAWDYAKARHLLFRAGFGGPPAEVEKLHALGLRQAVDYLVDFHQIADVNLPLVLGAEGVEGLDPPALVKINPQERSKLLGDKKGKNAVQYMQELRRWWISKMVKSPRPLEEKLVLFWHGIFATEWRTVRNPMSMGLQNQLFREHAAGNYAKLLHAIIYDAAMLRYLDNNSNKKGKPNENLAREIMELFSMGEAQGYTEKDVQQGARALTGYTFDPKTLEPKFFPKDHDDGDITLFGKTQKFNGDQFIDLILEQPATSRFIAFRLFNYFVYDEPSEELITELAKVLKDNKYELKPFLRTVFLSREFYGPKAMGTHFKSPTQLVAGTIRILGIKEYNPEPLVLATRGMNQDLFDPPNVKGWDGGEAWVNSVTLFARNNFTTNLIARGLDKTKFKLPDKPDKKGDKKVEVRALPKLDFVEAWKDQKFDTPAAVVDYCTRAFLVVPLSEQNRTRLLGVLGDLPPSAQWTERKNEVNRKIGNLLILIMSLPEYQLA